MPGKLDAWFWCLPCISLKQIYSSCLCEFCQKTSSFAEGWNYPHTLAGERDVFNGLLHLPPVYYHAVLWWFSIISSYSSEATATWEHKTTPEQRGRPSQKNLLVFSPERHFNGFHWALLEDRYCLCFWRFNFPHPTIRNSFHAADSQLPLYSGLQLVPLKTTWQNFSTFFSLVYLQHLVFFYTTEGSSTFWCLFFLTLGDRWRFNSIQARSMLVKGAHSDPGILDRPPCLHYSFLSPFLL